MLWFSRKESVLRLSVRTEEEDQLNFYLHIRMSFVLAPCISIKQKKFVFVKFFKDTLLQPAFCFRRSDILMYFSEGELSRNVSNYCLPGLVNAVAKYSDRWKKARMKRYQPKGANSAEETSRTWAPSAAQVPRTAARQETDRSSAPRKSLAHTGKAREANCTAAGEPEVETSARKSRRNWVAKEAAAREAS